MISATVQIIEDGPRNLVVRLRGEVTGGDAETAVEKITVASLSVLPGTREPCTRLALEGFQGSAENVAIKLMWEGSPHATAWSFPPNFAQRSKFRCAGAIKNAAAAATGDVLLSTDNYTSQPLDGRYNLTLWFRKSYQAALSVSPSEPSASIQLSAAAVSEDASVGDLVGVLSVAGGRGTYAFTLTDDAGGLFALDGTDDTRLEVAAALTAGADTVTVSADNGVDDPIARIIQVTITAASVGGQLDFSNATNSGLIAAIAA